MNTIHLYIRYICLAAAITLPVAASAQEDKTKENKNALNREMTLEKEYAPSVGDATKVNTLPAVKEPETRKVPVTYSDYTVPMEPTKEFGLFPSGRYMADMTYNKRRGYFNLGFGSYMNIDGDAGYHILNTDADKFNIYLSHRSTNGKVKYIDSDEKVKAKLNDNLGGFDYAHEFTRLRWNIGGSYGDTRFNYYGKVEMPPIENSDLATDALTKGWAYDTDTNQAHRALRFHSGVESKGEQPFNYMLDVNYVNFNQKYFTSNPESGLTENNLRALFDLNATLSGTGTSQFVGLGGRLDYLGYSIDNETTDNPFDNHALITLNPYYRVDGGNWHLKLGVIAALSTGTNDKKMVAPDVHIDYNPSEHVVLYGYATGEMRSNSVCDQSQNCRYSLLGSYIPSRNYIDAKVGVRSNAGSGFWFDLFGGYKYTVDELFNGTLYTPHLSTSSYLPSTVFGNRSYSCPYDASRIYAGADLKYSYQSLVDASLRVVYNHWKLDDADGYAYDSGAEQGTTTGSNSYDPIGKPTMEITAGITVRPINKLSIDARYTLATGRKAATRLYVQTNDNLYDQSDYGIKMKDINELNLRGTYTLNDTFGFYVQLNNVLFQKYEYIYGYPMQSFSAMGGININF